MDAHPRSCAVCNSRLVNLRQDAITCSGKCRTALCRQRKENTVVFKVRLPLDIYNNLVSTGITVDKYVQSLLQRACHA